MIGLTTVILTGALKQILDFALNKNHSSSETCGSIVFLLLLSLFAPKENVVFLNKNVALLSRHVALLGRIVVFLNTNVAFVTRMLRLSPDSFACHENVVFVIRLLRLS